MAEVQRWAIWNIINLDNIDPSNLPISKELVTKLNEWSDRYDKNYKLNEPNFHLNISFPTKNDEDDFYNEGWLLFERLKIELPDLELWYRDGRLDTALQERPK